MGLGPAPDVAFLSTVVTQDYLLTAMTALNIYEYAITFQQELEAIQNTKFTATSLLLIFTRYTTVLGSLANYLRYSESCRVYKFTSLAIASLVNIQTSGFSALRAYALTNRNMYVFLLVFVLGGLIPLAMSVTASATQRSTGMSSAALHSNQLGPCDPTIPLTGTKILYIYVYFLSEAGAEALVLFITWIKTVNQIRTAQRLGMTRFSLAECMMHNGSLYFITILCICIFALIGSAGGVPIVGQIAASAQWIPPLIANRFIISLRAIDRAQPFSQLSQACPTAQFQRQDDSVDDPPPGDYSTSDVSDPHYDSAGHTHTSMIAET